MSKINIGRRSLLASAALLSAPAFVRAQGTRPTVSFWIMDAINRDPVTKLLAGFTQRTGINVDLQLVPWAQAFSRWTTSFEAGTGADVSQCGGGGLFPAIFWDQKRLLDLTDVMGEIGASNYLSADWGRYKGAMTSVPWFLETRGLWYRKDWFAEAGLAPPTNWDELRKAAQRLTGNRRYGIALPYMRQFATGQANFTWYMNSRPKGDLDLARRDSSGQTEVSLDREAAIEALTAYTRFTTEDQSVPPGLTAGDSQSQFRLFTLGTAGMVIGNGAVALQAQQEGPALLAEDKVGLVPIPARTGPGHSFLGGSALWVNRATHVPAESKALVKFLASAEAQLALGNANLLTMPTSKVVLANASLNAKPFFSTMAKELDTARSYMWKAGPEPKLSRMYGNFTFEQPVLDVVVNHKTPAEAVAAYESALRTQLA
jgi:N,N'-diacetylchitobiose transport system substrate-binding protein